MSKWRRPAVLLIWLAAWCALDVWLVLFGERSDWEGLGAGILVGKYVCGQTLAGLSGRHWLHGLWLAFGLWALGSLVVVGMMVGWGVPWTETKGILFLVPLSLLVGSLPLWGLRFGRGWTFTSSGSAGRQTQLRIAHFMTLMALLPAAMSFALLFRLTLRYEVKDWQVIAGTTSTGFLLGGLAAPLVVWLLRGSQYSRKFSLLVPVASGLIVAVLWQASPDAGTVGAFFLLAIGLPLALLTALRLVDVRFVRVVERSPSGDHEESDAKSLWLTVVAAVVVAVASNLISNRIQNRQAKDRKSTELAEQHARLSTNKAKGSLALRPSATNDDLRSFLRYQDLVRLSLLGRHMNDESLLIVSQFPALKNVTVADANITDDGLEQLRMLPKLSVLNLPGCSIEGGGVSAFPSLTHLDLDRTKVNSNIVRRLSGLPLVSLSLSETAVDDAAFDEVEFRQLKSLNVCKTRVSGKTMRSFPNLETLVATDSRLDDVGVEALSGSVRLRYLELSNTRITDGCAATLATLPNLAVLHLAGTAFSNKGLARLAQGMETSTNRRAILDLSGTQITDAGLPDLARLNFLSVNLRDTQVTAAAILQTEGLRGGTLMIRARQFSREELKSLETFCTILAL